MNYFEIVHGPSRRTESDNNIHEYVFVCYDDSLDVKTEALKLINSEMRKRQMYESIMHDISVMVKNELFKKWEQPLSELLSVVSPEIVESLIVE